MTPRLHQPVNRRTRSLRTSLARLCAIFAVIALVGSCSGGTNESKQKDKDTGDVNQPPKVDPDNCPVSALDDATSPVEITVWHAYNALTQQAIEKAAADYNASQSKVKVNVEAQGTYPELLKKYEDRLGDPSSLPDVVFAEDTNLRFLVDSGSVIPSGDCIAADPDSKEFYDDLLPSVTATYAINGVLWPAAFGVSMPIMYVNNSQLKQAGLTDSTPLATLDDIRSAAEKIKAAGIPGVEEPVVMQLYGWYFENWITGAGQTIVNKDNGHSGLATKSTVDDKSAQEVLAWMHSMAKDGLLKAYPYSGDINQFLAIGNQTASILIDGSRAVTAVNAIVANTGQQIEGTEGLSTDDLKGIELKVMPIPGLKKAGQGGAAGSAGYVVAGDNPEKIAAGWDFLQYFNSPPSQVLWTTMGSYLPVTHKMDESAEIKDFFANDSGGKLLSVVKTQLENTDPEFPNPIIGPYDWFRTNVQSMMERVVMQGNDPKSNLTKFNSDFQSALDDYAKEVSG